MPQEGVIKFDLQFTSAPPVPEEEVRELGAWRTILQRLDLIGRVPDRYDGLAFGNISRRLAAGTGGERPFIITGTQTGGVEKLGADGYAVVRQCHPESNRVVAEGPVRPSAEALTHGTLYSLDPSVLWVMHVHSPEIWRRAADLEIPRTSPGAAYGTPELAQEIRSLLSDPVAFGLRILAVEGHEDGIFAFGTGAEEAGRIVLHYLSRALVMD